MMALLRPDTLAVQTYRQLNRSHMVSPHAMPRFEIRIRSPPQHASLPAENRQHVPFPSILRPRQQPSQPMTPSTHALGTQKPHTFRKLRKAKAKATAITCLRRLAPYRLPTRPSFHHSCTTCCSLPSNERGEQPSPTPAADRDPGLRSRREVLRLRRFEEGLGAASEGGLD